MGMMFKFLMVDYLRVLTVTQPQAEKRGFEEAFNDWKGGFKRKSPRFERCKPTAFLPVSSTQISDCLSKYFWRSIRGAGPREDAFLNIHFLPGRFGGTPLERPPSHTPLLKPPEFRC